MTTTRALPARGAGAADTTPIPVRPAAPDDDHDRCGTQHALTRKYIAAAAPPLRPTPKK